MPDRVPMIARRSVVALALVVAGCGQVNPTPATTVAPRPPPSIAPSSPPPVQTLTVAIDGDLSGGLSNAADGVPTQKAAAFLYDGLYSHDDHLAPVPRLAEDLATISADGLTWTIRLRPGVTFHDGSALTADDVVQTYELARSPNCRYDRTICLGAYLDAVAKVDDLTIAFTLKQKLASFGTRFLHIWIESEDTIDASYDRYLEGIRAVSPAETTTFLDGVASEEASPTGPAGPDGTPDVDYAQFQVAGEALLTKARVTLPNQAAYATDGVVDVAGYVRDIVTRVRAMDASTTDRPIDALAVAYPYLDFQDDPIGSGPFRFVSHTPGEGLEFAANEDYFRGAPTIQRLSFSIVETDLEGGQALASGLVDWKPSLQASTYDQIKDDPDLKFVEYLESSFVGLYFNLHPGSDALFLDRNLRQAVSYCFDKVATATTATDGHGAAIYSEIPPVSWAYPSAGLNTYPPDQAMARRLIEASGWSLGADGIYAKDGRRLSTVVAVRDGFSQRARWLESMGKQVRECGIDITYQEVGFAQILQMLDVYPHVNATAPESGRVFDAYFGGFAVTLDPDPYRLYHSSECSSAERPSTFNYICYQSAATDGLIQSGLVEFDQIRRAAIYHQYAILLSIDLPVIYAWSDKVREGLRTTVDTTAPGGLQLHTPFWFGEVEELTNAK